jgi:HJR/Mrr/RecB family endonuclease
MINAVKSPDKYNLAEKEFDGKSIEKVEQFMEDYFKEHGFIAS